MFASLIALLGKLVCTFDPTGWSPPPPPTKATMSQSGEQVTDMVELGATRPQPAARDILGLPTTSLASEAPLPTTPQSTPNFNFPLDGWTPPPKPSFRGTGILHQPILPTPMHHGNLMQGSALVECSNQLPQDTTMMSPVLSPYHPPPWWIHKSRILNQTPRGAQPRNITKKLQMVYNHSVVPRTMGRIVEYASTF
ncbi:hypothetical protein EDC04DRAFT_2605347 [Pisolithus marmoratus]|nr:hypothetical protein EDC04DRAFT_2605347 [Pisolithus marmoratus]